MTPDPALEREAVQDVARLMLTWAARLPEGSDVGRRFDRTAARLPSRGWQIGGGGSGCLFAAPRRSVSAWH